jgi:thymidylate synthase (FAD)
MHIIEQSYEILSLPENLLQMIEVAGRTCYKSEDKIGCTANINIKEHCNGFLTPTDGVCTRTKCKHHSSWKLIKNLLNRDHHAMIEFGDMTVRFITNRGVTHELVRHRLCSFAQESTRYVRYDGKMEFIRPCWWDASTDMQKNTWKDAICMAEQYYLDLLQQGWRPEQAREVLPNSLKTEIVVKTNLREWRHMFQLRCSKKAHPQIRALMLPLLAELKTKVPVVFDDLYPKFEIDSGNDSIQLITLDASRTPNEGDALKDYEKYEKAQDKKKMTTNGVYSFEIIELSKRKQKAPCTITECPIHGKCQCNNVNLPCYKPVGKDE